MDKPESSRRKIFFRGWRLVAGVVAVVLFGVLWKAAAPVRAQRQFEAQAMAQLAHTQSAQGNTFNSLRITNFRYDRQKDAYEVQYQLNYGTPSSPTSLWSACSLSRRDGAFQSQCFGASGPSGSSSTFTVSIPEW